MAEETLLRAIKKMTIRVDLNPAITESTHCIPLGKQICLQQCNLNFIKTQCQPACQPICQQNCVSIVLNDRSPILLMDLLKKSSYSNHIFDQLSLHHFKCCYHYNLLSNLIENGQRNDSKKYLQLSDFQGYGNFKPKTLAGRFPNETVQEL
ncbi:hypothetical protein X798_02524 [Onchocerca flexuosa]|uniref:Uncharacterized protein n=1 Tax=Onchocerca flexuosa TaxID=387005 RepID=A0A238C0G9_9BILA|nr:hypothetical protein X798_02524 [Onchocerca flexuosa]